MAESYTDVVVVGAGPAGLMASLYLSELGVKHRVLDQLGTRTLNGRADGVGLRTVEIWDSFDLATKLESHGNHFSEWGLWTATENGIARKGRKSLMNEDQSRKSLWTIHQGFLEAGLIEGAQKRGGPMIDRGSKPVSLVIDSEDTAHASSSTYPLRLTVRYLHESELLQLAVGAHTKLGDGSLKAKVGSVAAFGNDPENTVFSGIQAAKQGSTETIHTKFIIGSDGAHSWVRRQLGFEMSGANSDTIWAVMDIIPITDFPDIRKFCTILSAHGGMLIIPRENKLVRLYIQLPEEGTHNISLENPDSPLEIFKTAKQIFHPHSLDYTYSDWWTVYKVGHRLSSGFSYNNRIFLAGDAVHTHTPKAGQGSNVSQQDGFNLAWKIAGVLHGQLKQSVLTTYESERQPVAAELIGLDKELSGVLGNRTGVDQKKVDAAYARLAKFGSHITIEYDTNILVAPQPKHNAISTLLVHGTRIRNAYVYNHASGNLTATHRILLSTGSWNLFVLAGNMQHDTQAARLHKLGEHLKTLVSRYPHISTQSASPSFLRIQLLTANKLSDFTAKEVHPVFFPRDPKYGFDYDTLFGDFQADGADMRKPEHSRELDGAHRVYGVDPERGGLILLRPDQVISWTGHLEESSALEAFFEGCMLHGTTNGV